MADKDVALVQRPVEMRAIPGFEGRYSVTRDGRVWSHGIHANQYGPARKKPRWLGRYIRTGYWSVNLRVTPERGAGFSVHVLVLLAWGPPRPSDAHECNHIDGNKLNNHISNLEWATREQQVRHAVAHGLYRSGSRSASAKLTEAQVLEIRRLYANGVTRKELSRQFGIAYGAIWHICNRSQWRSLS